MAYATVTDLEGRWRPLSDAEKARAGVLLTDAAIEIDVRAPLDAEPTAAETAVRLVVSCRMVKRAMASTVGDAPVTQAAQTAGPFTMSQTYANPMGDLYLTKADLRLLGVGRQRAFTVSMWPDEVP